MDSKVLVVAFVVLLSPVGAEIAEGCMLPSESCDRFMFGGSSSDGGRGGGRVTGGELGAIGGFAGGAVLAGEICGSGFLGFICSLGITGAASYAGNRIGAQFDDSPHEFYAGGGVPLDKPRPRESVEDTGPLYAAYIQDYIRAGDNRYVVASSFQERRARAQNALCMWECGKWAAVATAWGAMTVPPVTTPTAVLVGGPSASVAAWAASRS